MAKFDGRRLGEEVVGEDGKVSWRWKEIYGREMCGSRGLGVSRAGGDLEMSMGNVGWLMIAIMLG